MTDIWVMLFLLVKVIIDVLLIVEDAIFIKRNRTRILSKGDYYYYL